MSFPGSYAGTASYLNFTKCGTNGTTLITTISKSWVSERSPNWPDRPLPVNPYTMSLMKRRPCYLTLRNDFNPNNDCDRLHKRTPEGFGYGPPAVANIMNSVSAASKADGSARLRAKDQAVNWAQNIAEIGQVFHLAAATLRRLKEAALGIATRSPKRVLRAFAISSRDVGRVQRGVKPADAANLWLELQYGWKPLYKDLHDSLSKATSRIALADHVFQSVGKGRAHSKVSVPTGPVAGSLLRSTMVDTVAFAKTYLWYTISDSQRASLTAAGLTNPYSLAWEIVPFSFVVDWFLPIGDFLNSLDAVDNLTFVGGYRSELKRQKAEMVHSGTPGHFEKWSQDGKDLKFLVSMSRSGLTSFPKAPLPQFQNPFSPTHIANALALFASALDRMVGK